MGSFIVQIVGEKDVFQYTGLIGLLSEIEAADRVMINNEKQSERYDRNSFGSFGDLFL